MPLEGELVVRLVWDGAGVREARPSAARPRASRALVGRPAGEAPALAGRLFAICGRAQSVAAEAACRAARGARAHDAELGAAEMRVRAERVHEHLWRLLVDWPRLVGLEARPAALGAARLALAPLVEDGAAESAAALEARVASLDRIALREIYGAPAAEWLAIADRDALGVWAHGGATPVATVVAALLDEPAVSKATAESGARVALLPPADEAGLRAGVAAALDRDPDFESAPHWRGAACETGPLARTDGHPLLRSLRDADATGIVARVAARLIELAADLEALGAGDDAPAAHGAFAPGPNEGLAWVETARGLLVHRARLADGRIADYRIVAPTEWNFHPRGAFVHDALAIEAGSEDDVERRARRLAASLDPCVALRLEIDHA